MTITKYFKDCIAGDVLQAATYTYIVVRADRTNERGLGIFCCTSMEVVKADESYPFIYVGNITNDFQEFAARIREGI